jgi:uncharacterized membrane protein YecN with MAPEG domain
LALLGGLNLTLGLVLAFYQPGRSGDLWTVYEWCHQWLYDGVPLFGSADSPDYPPNAIVTYAWLATIPRPWVVTVWALTTLALTPFLPYAVLRFASPSVRVSSSIVPAILFLCWGGVRTVLQFSQLSFLLAFVGLSMPDRWAVAGVCLGLALAKPHIAGPIALWAACTGRFRMAVVAAAVVAIEYVVYCLRVGSDLLQPAVGWMQALRHTYSGPNALNGHTSVRPWVAALITDGATADAVWISIAVMALIVLCFVAVRDRTQTLAIPGLLCLWSLLTIYHNLNNLILLLPAFIFLLTVDDPGTRRQRAWMVGIIQTVLMLDIPVRLRDLSGGIWGAIVLNADRIVVLSTFAFVAWLWWRLQRIAQIQPRNISAAHRLVATSPGSL